jgi:hypothetical protein
MKEQNNFVRQQVVKAVAPTLMPAEGMTGMLRFTVLVRDALTCEPLALCIERQQWFEQVRGTSQALVATWSGAAHNLLSDIMAGQDLAQKRDIGRTMVDTLRATYLFNLDDQKAWPDAVEPLPVELTRVLTRAGDPMETLIERIARRSIYDTELAHLLDQSKLNVARKQLALLFSGIVQALESGDTLQPTSTLTDVRASLAAPESDGPAARAFAAMRGEIAEIDESMRLAIVERNAGRDGASSQRLHNLARRALERYCAQLQPRPEPVCATPQ